MSENAFAYLAADNTTFYDAELGAIVTATLDRLESELYQHTPYMAPRVLAWLRSMPHDGRLESYVMQPRAYPLLPLPWWLAKSLADRPDIEFHTNLAYSSLNGYFFIRLLDNVMDGEATVEKTLLPVAGVFHSRFQDFFHQVFGNDHPFWNLFTATWARSADLTVRDALLEDVFETDFLATSGKKFAAAMIPVGAVCYRYERPDLIDPWSHFLDLLGCWYQMVNDLFGWLKDEKLGHRTYFLCEAERCRGTREPVKAWVAREGFEWGASKIEEWMTEMKLRAARLQCPQVESFLRERSRLFAERKLVALDGLQAINQLLEILK